jgi:HK97 family phage prohead protease
MASVYGELDLGDDICDPGCFAKTLAIGGPERPLLWQHRDPIGKCSLTDTGTGLGLKGKLSLGLQAGKDAYTLLKDGVVTGLSIGYSTVKDSFVGEIRHLQELKLWEVSLVTFPMLPSAQVSSVKAAQQVAQHAEIRRALKSFRKEILEAL